MTVKSILFFTLIFACNFSFCYAQNDPAKKQNTSEVNGTPLVFGVVADIQYADKDALRGRFYRASINNLKNCVAAINDENPVFTVQLGDIIDGHKDDNHKTRADLDSVVRVISHLNMPLHHVIGNHDMLAGKAYLEAKLNMKSFYYDFTTPSCDGWRFVVLDGNDGGYGIMTDSQVEWFSLLIKEAEKRGEKVICFCHYALVPDAAANHRMAKPEPVLEILDSTGCVKAWFAGHDHKGGYCLRKEVHHITMKGMVEAPEKNSFAIVKLYPDKMIINGLGKEESRLLQF
ncbi:hypothetical protein D1164_21760 [Mariniphaga sediminis]|uniref:Calcineurin-like phosphoesterase domain-containing protein n=1 Tax=Mariniphaga sediminis TaxID=1628158 RepID=A0A399CTF3_9BACT|nr:metallophosphoesterase [Mariniphaga sediminis]RIH63059.1 hypothetical protein D1164_21760 [Mariniphaga sediminis]